MAGQEGGGESGPNYQKVETTPTLAGADGLKRTIGIARMAGRRYKKAITNESQKGSKTILTDPYQYRRANHGGKY